MQEKTRYSSIDDYSNQFGINQIDARIRSLLLQSGNAQRVLQLLDRYDLSSVSYWHIWYYFALYQRDNDSTALKSAHDIALQKNYQDDPWLLHIIGRYAYEFAGHPLIGLRYLRRAIAIAPIFIWQSEYAILCYYTNQISEAQQYLSFLIDREYHKKNGYLFSLYIDVLIRSEEFPLILSLYRSYRPIRRLPMRDLLIFFKLEELFGDKAHAYQLAKRLYAGRAYLDETNYAFLLLYFLKKKNYRYADVLYQDCTANHSLSILARVLYAMHYKLQDVYGEREWYRQVFRIYSFIDHSFLLYINSGMIELHQLAKKIQHSATRQGSIPLHYNLHDLWQRYGVSLFFLGEKPLLSTHFIRSLYQLQAGQYASVEMQLHGIWLTYQSRFFFLTKNTLPFGYYLLRAELAAKRGRWRTATQYYRHSLSRFPREIYPQNEYQSWLFVEVVAMLFRSSLQYLHLDRVIKKSHRLVSFYPEHFPFILYKAHIAKIQNRTDEVTLWQFQIDQQLQRRWKTL
ncbi:hypothetical protein PVA45_01055 [Entomospira entomophila]|uniref:Tetratricopeptide repeat protein n=1 Tax=Entomospira entomophila TaxID=2719988 RepID=A0A968KQW1_9SPIO|nr:hypothetical protein [Entomospira entomophilus]NIZ40108.1 hypothetical protein [Entomospira entomophilus]WDI35668.1 hypothetical protein PVA45_01055 [Entomospira entomophilus]